VLEPESRQALLDCLQPPAGFIFDRAVGTTYTLDLLALLTAPLAFALFNTSERDTDGIPADPIALLESVRRHADRIDIFCQAGLIGPMRSFRPIVGYLEGGIHASASPQPGAIFHPKVWLIRFVASDGDERRYRLLCLSRNLTFDQSWDTALVLDGELGGAHDRNAPLTEFVRALPALAVTELTPDRAAAVRELADELADVHFAPPPGWDEVRFWPLGHDRQERWPFEGRIDSMLVISPFITASLLDRLRAKRKWDRLLSRVESIDHVGGSALERFYEVLILNPDAYVTDELGTTDGAQVGESSVSKLRGLHAKSYLADSGRFARLWTGSANATDAAFGGNVEFLVELIGKRRHVGIHRVLDEGTGQPTLRTIVEPYRPTERDPVPLSPEEEVERDLEALCRNLGSYRWQGELALVEPDVYRVELTGRPSANDRPSGDTVGRAWPVAIQGAATPLRIAGERLQAQFSAVSFEHLSSFFAIEVTVERERLRRTATFVVNAGLIGEPEDRRERILASLLRNRQELLQFLLMLLGNAEFGASLQSEGDGGGTWAFHGWGSVALFEPLVRALSQDPSRLDEIAGLVEQLAKSPTGLAVLPDGWAEIWDPIWAARQELGP
jgi:hypothetical protein